MEQWRLIYDRNWLPVLCSPFCFSFPIKRERENAKKNKKRLSSLHRHSQNLCCLTCLSHHFSWQFSSRLTLNSDLIQCMSQLLVRSTVWVLRQNLLSIDCHVFCSMVLSSLSLDIRTTCSCHPWPLQDMRRCPSSVGCAQTVRVHHPSLWWMTFHRRNKKVKVLLPPRNDENGIIASLLGIQ